MYQGAHSLKADSLTCSSPDQTHQEKDWQVLTPWGSSSIRTRGQGTSVECVPKVHFLDEEGVYYRNFRSWNQSFFCWKPQLHWSISPFLLKENRNWASRVSPHLIYGGGSGGWGGECNLTQEPLMSLKIGNNIPTYFKWTLWQILKYIKKINHPECPTRKDYSLVIQTKFYWLWNYDLNTF